MPDSASVQKYKLLESVFLNLLSEPFCCSENLIFSSYLRLDGDYNEPKLPIVPWIRANLLIVYTDPSFPDFSDSAIFFQMSINEGFNPQY